MKKLLLLFLTLFLMWNTSTSDPTLSCDLTPVISHDITSENLKPADLEMLDATQSPAQNNQSTSHLTDTITPTINEVVKMSCHGIYPNKDAITPTPQSVKDNIYSYNTNINTNTIILSFAGDCTIGSDESFTWNTFDDVYQKEADPEYFFDGAKSLFATDDFTFVNLESTFTNATIKAEKEYCYKGKPSYSEILVKGSIEGVTLANNHTLDYLQKGFDDTIDTLNKAGILYTHFETYFITEIKGIKIGFLGYKGWSHEQKANELLIEQVKEMRNNGVDFIIANYHWGDMRSYAPNALQKRMAHYAIDNGVDLVIGHHPHVIQGMETYKGRNILYSLGNFCYGGSPNPSDQDTIIYQHIINVDTVLNEIISSNYSIVPALISSDANRNNYQPIIATGKEKNRIIEKFLKLCEELN